MTPDVFETRSLTEVELPPLMDSSEYNLIEDFFQPLLHRSVRYDRGIGYFSPGWLSIASKGVASIAERGGEIRWVMSPPLDEGEWKAIRWGEKTKTDSILRNSLRKSVDELEKNLEGETLSALAWMIADSILRIRLAVPRGEVSVGEFHAKLGIFTDSEGNQVAFCGSYNETVEGVLNYESIKIFPSWKEEYRNFVEPEAKRFERLWNNKDPNVRVLTLPESIKRNIVNLRIDNSRPYPQPGEAVSGRVPRWVRSIDFQEEAIEEWFESGERGILEMATGSGKTIVALRAICRYLDDRGSSVVIVTTPLKHLVEQWENVSRSFGFDPIPCFGSRRSWEDRVNDEIVKFNLDMGDEVFLIATHSTFTREPMQNAVKRIRGENAVLIADEAHHLGSKKYRVALPENMNARLGLTATPRRWHDPRGTEELLNYFGGIIFRFPLKRAIEEGCLCPYEYHPHLVELTESEIQEYRYLTGKIGRLMAKLEQEDERENGDLTALLNKRANIIKKAVNKLEAARGLVRRGKDISHALFYCAPDQEDQFKKVVRMLGEEGLLTDKFFSDTSNAERAKLLSDLAEEKLDALVAMGCLDEGVDVPSIETAYFLASSGNPLQFIQRRGRILRKSEGKEKADIHDFIVVPYLEDPRKNLSRGEFKTERKIMKRELHRFKEFADSAMNKFESREEVLNVAKAYNVLDF